MEESVKGNGYKRTFETIIDLHSFRILLPLNSVKESFNLSSGKGCIYKEKG